MSRTVARTLTGFARLATLPLKHRRRQAALALTAERLVQQVDIPTPQGTLVLSCPTARSINGAYDFFESDTEVLQWIDTHVQAGDVFWDIGANIGIYALYAAATKQATVLAFEPSASTYAVLIRNLELNHMDRVQAYCLAFADKTGAGMLNMARTEAGHSMHAFDTKTTEQSVFSQSVLGFTMDEFIQMFHVPAPRHIKLDVDGIEDAILAGATRTLAGVQSLMVEIVDPDSAQSRTIHTLLAAQGLFPVAGATPAQRNILFLKKQTG